MRENFFEEKIVGVPWLLFFFSTDEKEECFFLHFDEKVTLTVPLRKMIHFLAWTRKRLTIYVKTLQVRDFLVEGRSLKYLQPTSLQPNKWATYLHLLSPENAYISSWQYWSKKFILVPFLCMILIQLETWRAKEGREMEAKMAQKEKRLAVPPLSMRAGFF